VLIYKRLEKGRFRMPRAFPKDAVLSCPAELGHSPMEVF